MRNTLALLLLTASTGFCQTADKPDTLQSLLSEVRQLRQAIETMTAASQRVQIALYMVQMQDSAVARETARFNNVHDKCTELQGGQQRITTEIQKLEGDQSAGTIPPQEAPHVQGLLADMKHRLEATSAEAQACQATEAEASSQLRKQQAILSDLQERLQRLDKALEKSAEK